MSKEIEDVHALFKKTRANYIMGVSSGALISLQAAFTLPTIQKAVIFEPPLIINDSLSTKFTSRFNQAIDRGKIASALVIGMKGAKMGPPIMNVFPNWLLKVLTNRILSSEDKKASENDVTLRKLAPTLRHDFQLVEQMSDTLERFKEMNAEVLLLGGSKSPAYLKMALDGLEEVIPKVKRIKFSGLGHGATGNTDRGGQPEVVAQALCRFFN
jgi:pimeloyl-ACP methyl ester carboxylesterase